MKQRSTFNLGLFSCPLVLPRAHVRFISQIATHASMSEQEAIFVSS